MDRRLGWVIAIVIVGALGTLAYLRWRHEPAPPAEPVAAQPASAPAPAEPAIKYPLSASDTTQAASLPSLDDSDDSVKAALTQLFGGPSVEQFLVPKEVIRHFVVSIDNLPNKKLAERLRPIQPTPGAPKVEGSDDARVLSAQNFARYSPLVQLLSATSTQQLMSTYQEFYPLMQQAYEQLGHPPQYFNDRVVAVIDHLLATPDVEGPIKLTQPNVMYEFADPQLEARSAGQKLLIRMGPNNAAIVKAKLREIRAELTKQSKR